MRDTDTIAAIVGKLEYRLERLIGQAELLAATVQINLERGTIKVKDNDGTLLALANQTLLATQAAKRKAADTLLAADADLSLIGHRNLLAPDAPDREAITERAKETSANLRTLYKP